MLNLDWLAADPATFDWPPRRHRELERKAAAIAAGPIDVEQLTPWTFVRGLHVPAAAIAPSAAAAIAEIPIDPQLVAAIAGARP
jgi:hypothetical protein